MDSINLVGTLAATLTTASFLPQAFRVYKTKHTKDLSLPMYIIFSLGVFLWTWFGLLTHSWPIIIANGVTLVLCFWIVAMKFIYK